MHKLVLLRHGESQWNLENRFTGWHDVNLTEQGEREGREAGRLLKAEGFEFDMAYCSVLTRAIRTLWLALTDASTSTCVSLFRFELNWPFARGMMIGLRE